MTELTAFLREQTRSGANKCCRMPLPSAWSVADAQGGIPLRKALVLQKLFEEMPVFIGARELIVGTRTVFGAAEGNEDGHDPFLYRVQARVPYLRQEEIDRFGGDQSYRNKTHYTPDFSILLELGVGGILQKAEDGLQNADLTQSQIEFLCSVRTAYTAFRHLILRYADEAERQAADAVGDEKARLLSVRDICRHISAEKPRNFREAVQLLWFGHLGCIIESSEFINYGRLDVILNPYLGDMPRAEALQIIECLLLKMYDQVDIVDTYLHTYAAQLVVTLGGVLPSGENAVNEVTMLFLDAIDSVRLPEPEFNLRISPKNPDAFLDRAAELTVSGCNFISYYNDDRFVEALTNAGIPAEDARCFGFDLCQDINIPGKADFYYVGSLSLAAELLGFLGTHRDFATFDALMDAWKEVLREKIRTMVDAFNAAQKHLFLYRDEQYDRYFAECAAGAPPDWYGRSPMCPLPFLSALYHGTVENAVDLIYEGYPIKEKGFMVGTATEAINSLAAIKKTVYEEHLFTLDAVIAACEADFRGEALEHMRNVLWNAPKWGNDDAFADGIAEDLLSFCLAESVRYRTASGGRVLGGIHQPHPIPTGAALPATPEGRHSGTPTAVTLTPESGTMHNGPTAALASAAKVCSDLVQWNFCVMVNYPAAVFKGDNGCVIFKQMLEGYFRLGGLQHQPNVLHVETLKAAQLSPAAYKDLIVRLWGVSAHFVDLPRELQDELIARYSV